MAKNGFYNNISQLLTLQQNSFEAFNGHDMSPLNGSTANGYLGVRSLSPTSLSSPSYVDPFFASRLQDQELLGLRQELYTMVNAFNVISQAIANISARVDNMEINNRMAVEALNRPRSLSYSNGSDTSSLEYLTHQQSLWQSDGVTSNIDSLPTTDISFSTDTTTNGSIAEPSNSFVGD